MKWMTNRYARMAVLLLLPAAILFIRNTGVQEVHRERELINFPIVDARPAPGDWPWWRGVDRSNSMPDEHPPLRWSDSENNGWNVPVPGRGHASPCIWGERIFLPTAESGRETISLLCLDHSSGQSLWHTDIHRGGLTPLPARYCHASPTPACDGQHVFVVAPVNGALVVTAVDMNGRIDWQREAGPYSSKWEYRSSPAIYKSLVIVAADNKGAQIDRLVGASYIAALHRKTGEIVWRIRRPAADSCGTPVIAHMAGRDQLLLAGNGAVTAYDPLTGETMWFCRWSADRAANSVAFDDQRVFASARHPKHELLCIRADGQGDVTSTHVQWRETKLAGEATSPVVFQGRVFALTDDGILACLDSGSGQVHWKRRLGGLFSSSPIIAGQNLYCLNEDGTAFVVKAGGRGDVLTEIPLGESIFASPIVSRHRLYLRTIGHLKCIEAPDEAPLAVQPEQRRRQL